MKIDRKKLVSLMMDHEMNGVQLAKKSQVSRNTISAIRHGKTCSIETATKIANAFSMSTEELLEK